MHTWFSRFWIFNRLRMDGTIDIGCDYVAYKSSGSGVSLLISIVSEMSMRDVPVRVG